MRFWCLPLETPCLFWVISPLDVGNGAADQELHVSA